MHLTCLNSKVIIRYRAIMAYYFFTLKHQQVATAEYDLSLQQKYYVGLRLCWCWLKWCDKTIIQPDQLSHSAFQSLDKNKKQAALNLTISLHFLTANLPFHFNLYFQYNYYKLIRWKRIILESLFIILKPTNRIWKWNKTLLNKTT